MVRLFCKKRMSLHEMTRGIMGRAELLLMPRSPVSLQHDAACCNLTIDSAGIARHLQALPLAMPSWSLLIGRFFLNSTDSSHPVLVLLMLLLLFFNNIWWKVTSCAKKTTRYARWNVITHPSAKEPKEIVWKELGRWLGKPSVYRIRAGESDLLLLL